MKIEVFFFFFFFVSFAHLKVCLCAALVDFLATKTQLVELQACWHANGSLKCYNRHKTCLKCDKTYGRAVL